MAKKGKKSNPTIVWEHFGLNQKDEFVCVSEYSDKRLVRMDKDGTFYGHPLGGRPAANELVAVFGLRHIKSYPPGFQKVQQQIEDEVRKEAAAALARSSHAPREGN